jgi:SAM-dependent methyltransferase
MTEANPSRIVDACQICGNSSLDQIMFLGFLPPVNDFHPIGQRPKEESRYPAEIVFCPNCHLLQSGYIVDPKIIFPASYPYTSSTTKVLRDNFAELFREVSDLFPLTPEDLVIDIGSNDGNLLRNFQGHSRVLGITPEDIGTIAIEHGIPTILDYFTKDVVRKVRQEYGQAKIVTATNVFAHIDNVNDVVDSVLDLLVSDGVFIIEVHYLVPIVQMNQFDTIYHEHLRHYSLHSLQYLLAAHGLEIIHAKPIPSHAGSIRVYTARRGVYPKRDTVAPLLEREERTVLTKEQLVEFRKNAFDAKTELCALLSEIKKRGERIYGIGAPSRGTTLIHYVGIDEGIVDCILEIQGSHKIGKYVPGTLIPVLEESKLYEDQPEYALLFSWQITDELIPKIRAKGFKGKFIVPLPHAKVV